MPKDSPDFAGPRTSPGATSARQSAQASDGARAHAAPLWVAAGLALGPAVTLGLARFAYALLLPAMRADLGWSYAQAGTMNTINAAGYLLGAMFSARIAALTGTRRAFLGGIVVTGLSLLASAFVRDLAALLLFRLIAGTAGALAFVTGAGLAAHAAAGGGNGRPALILGFYTAGGGLGVLASALSVPLLVGGKAADWPLGWIALGLASLAAALVAAPAATRANVKTSGALRSKKRWSWRALMPTFVSYGLFGAGYIAYMTFIVAYLRTHGLGTAQISVFWAALGFAGLVAPFLWAPIFARLRGGWGLALVLAILTVGAALPLASSSLPAAYASAVLFGGTLLAVVTGVTILGRKATPPEAWTAAMGALTTIFALGQCVGPVLAGALSDGPGGVRVGLALSAAVLVASTLAACLQREHEHPTFRHRV